VFAAAFAARFGRARDGVTTVAGSVGGSPPVIGDENGGRTALVRRGDSLTNREWSNSTKRIRARAARRERREERERLESIFTVSTTPGRRIVGRAWRRREWRV